MRYDDNMHTVYSVKAVSYTNLDVYKRQALGAEAQFVKSLT